MAVKAIPDGYSTVTPYLRVDGATKLIEFITTVFGGKERMRMPTPDGKVGHAEIEVGDSLIMLSDATHEFPATTAMVHVYVENVDEVYQRATAAGAVSLMAPEDRFYGDRAAEVRDACGIEWSIATHVEEVSEEEMMKRMAALGEG